VKPGDLVRFNVDLGPDRNLYARDEHDIMNLSPVPVYAGVPCIVLDMARCRPFVSDRMYDFVHVVTPHGTGWSYFSWLESL
jgi:hypothetical protein